jgi:hypothetical protein
MIELGFGQPGNAIIQLGYVVPDINSAMTRWTADMRVGPWFVIKRFGGVNPIYRGAPATALCEIALGFAGHIQIELICPSDNEPSVYKEHIERRGYGFHHFGVATTNMDSEINRLTASGYELAFTALVPTGGRVAYLDTGEALPGMIELIEADAGLNDMFTAIYQASLGWDGSDPVRTISM